MVVARWYHNGIEQRNTHYLIQLTEYGWLPTILNHADTIQVLVPFVEPLPSIAVEERRRIRMQLEKHL
ncbi:hypothetical protein AFLA_003834 [Aspergillus flavus NRRL3357]|nr:hypothetical protein AFLA_003834 [Aspergillus flavus NRRL3357]